MGLHHCYTQTFTIQNTFTEFVTELRTDYKDKVRAFTHIINICLVESARRDDQWKLQAEVHYCKPVLLPKSWYLSFEYLAKYFDKISCLFSLETVSTISAYCILAIVKITKLKDSLYSKFRHSEFQ